MSDESLDQPALKQVTIYTDGAAVPNPGAGGYGVVLRFGEHAKELSGGFRRTTNNRMELMAVIVGLEALKLKCKVTLHSDSQYIINAVTSGSVFRWRDNSWTMNATKTRPTKNADLWRRLLAAYEKHEVEMVWVKGHAGIADNERCDVLALNACQQPDLSADEGYAEVEPNLLFSQNVAAPSALPQSNTKIVAEGQPCRKCGTAVVKRAPRKKAVKASQTYRYAWYLYCPSCTTMYMVEEAKEELNGDG